MDTIIEESEFNENKKTTEKKSKRKIKATNNVRTKKINKTKSSNDVELNASNTNSINNKKEGKVIETKKKQIKDKSNISSKKKKESKKKIDQIFTFKKGEKQDFESNNATNSDFTDNSNNNEYRIKLLNNISQVRVNNLDEPDIENKINNNNIDAKDITNSTNNNKSTEKKEKKIHFKSLFDLIHPENDDKSQNMDINRQRSMFSINNDNMSTITSMNMTTTGYIEFDFYDIEDIEKEDNNDISEEEKIERNKHLLKIIKVNNFKIKSTLFGINRPSRWIIKKGNLLKNKRKNLWEATDCWKLGLPESLKEEFKLNFYGDESEYLDLANNNDSIIYKKFRSEAPTVKTSFNFTEFNFMNTNNIEKVDKEDNILEIINKEILKHDHKDDESSYSELNNDKDSNELGLKEEGSSGNSKTGFFGKFLTIFGLRKKNKNLMLDNDKIDDGDIGNNEDIIKIAANNFSQNFPYIGVNPEISYINEANDFYLGRKRLCCNSNIIEKINTHNIKSANKEICKSKSLKKMNKNNTEGEHNSNNDIYSNNTENNKHVHIVKEEEVIGISNSKNINKKTIDSAYSNKQKNNLDNEKYKDKSNKSSNAINSNGQENNKNEPKSNNDNNNEDNIYNDDGNDNLIKNSNDEMYEIGKIDKIDIKALIRNFYFERENNKLTLLSKTKQKNITNKHINISLYILKSDNLNELVDNLTQYYNVVSNNYLNIDYKNLDNTTIMHYHDYEVNEERDDINFNFTRVGILLKMKDKAKHNLSFILKRIIEVVNNSLDKDYLARIQYY